MTDPNDVTPSDTSDREPGVVYGDAPESAERKHQAKLDALRAQQAQDESEDD